LEGRELAALRAPWGGFERRSIAFSPDGKWVAAGSEQGIAHVWDITTKKEVLRLSRNRKGEQERSESAGPLVFTPDGRHLVTGGWDGAVRVWDLARGKEERCFRFMQGPILSLALSPDGKVAAIRGGGRRLCLCDLA